MGQIGGRNGGAEATYRLMISNTVLISRSPHTNKIASIVCAMRRLTNVEWTCIK